MAVPHPEDELTRFGKLLARGLPPLLVITGPSDFFRVQAADRALASVPKGGELRIIDANDDPGDGGDGDGDESKGTEREAGVEDAAGLAACPELQDLCGGGLFVKTAFVVVRRGSAWWQRHVGSLAAHLPRFAKGCGLVLEAAKLEKRKKVAQGLVKSLADGGALFEFRDMWEQPFDRRSPLDGELCKWVVERARQLGVALQPKAAWLLVGSVGKAPAELLAELGRLRDRLGADGKRAPLAPDDLRGKLTTSFESTPFELAEAVLGDDRRAAFRSLRAMFDRGVRGKDGKTTDAGGVLPFATSWLYQQLARTLEGRQLLDSGRSEGDVVAELGVRQFVERFVAQVRKLDAARLRRGLLALHACQRASRLTGEDPDVLLERFLRMWFDGLPIPSLEDMEA